MFRKAFLDALDETGLSIAEIARRSGVSKEQLSKLKQRENAKTNVDDARRVAAAFGYTLDDFLEDERAQSQFEIVGLLSKLTQQERDFLIKAARGLVEEAHQEAD